MFLQIQGARSSAQQSVRSNLQPLSADVFHRAKIAYSCRRVEFHSSMVVLSDDRAPRLGELVLAEVDMLGQHKAIEGRDGRRANLFPGDLVIVCYGSRYAPHQFEAEIPGDLGPCALVAAGGMASRVITQHVSMSPATGLRPIGLIGDANGRPVNLLDWALPTNPDTLARPHVVAVLGTSMNAGKTTTAANLVRGLVRAGYRVGAAKVTGTGSPKDVGLMLDAGAHPVVDFTDAGYPSTYRLSLEQLETVLTSVIAHLAKSSVDVVVLEVADGLYQRETELLCLSKQFAATVDGILFAAGDAMGAKCGADWLIQRNLPLLGISGLLTSAPLAIREAEKATGLPVYDLSALNSSRMADALGINLRFRCSA